MPPVDADATGAGTIGLDFDQSTITFNGTFTNLTGAPTAANLNDAPAGQNGPVATDANGKNIVFTNVPATASGTIPAQSFAVNPAFVAQLSAGDIYENIQTAINPGGEIRGQFAPAPAFTVTMIGFTIKNGKVASANEPAGTGGGIRDQGNASLKLVNMVVTKNTASGDGGGIAMENTVSAAWTLTINHSTISDNMASDAGGGVETDGSGTVIINAGTLITGNTSTNQGAGIWLDAIQVGTVFQSAALTLKGVRVTSNTGNVGGGVGNAGDGAVTIIGSSVENNRSSGIGGGFADQNGQGTLTVLNSFFLVNNATADGGGIAPGGPITSITNSEIDDNTSSASGGGIFADGATLFVQNSTIVNNHAADGAGIELDTTGAGLNASTITACTITLNTAMSTGASGGGIDAGADFSGDLLLLNDTINANTASVGGGVFWAASGNSTFNVQNTIIAGNTAPVGPDAASDQAFTASLSAAQEVPPTTSAGTGGAGILLSADQTTITVNLSFSGLSGAPTAAQLQNAPAGQNGPVATDANGKNLAFTGVPAAASGSIPQQSFTVNAAFVSQLQQGNIYTNIDTAADPNGEIRGQFALADGTFHDLGGNLIGVSGAGSGNSGFTAATTQTGTVATPLKALLGPLQNNGGPTIGAAGARLALDTELLQLGSVAIGQGVLPKAPAYDERGLAFVVNGAINVGATTGHGPAVKSTTPASHRRQG